MAPCRRRRTLKEFGRRESDARLALRLIRELRLNQHGIIGSPTPSLEYWLSDGLAAARPGRPDYTLLPIDSPSLRVEQTESQWVLRDQHRVLFNFGGDEGGARQALAVIHKYGFTEVGVVNPAAPSMVVFLARRRFAGGHRSRAGASSSPGRSAGQAGD